MTYGGAPDRLSHVDGFHPPTVCEGNVEGLSTFTESKYIAVAW